MYYTYLIDLLQSIQNDRSFVWKVLMEKDLATYICWEIVRCSESTREREFYESILNEIFKIDIFTDSKVIEHIYTKIIDWENGNL